jgi:hypothetical protein
MICTSRSEQARSCPFKPFVASGYFIGVSQMGNVTIGFDNHRAAEVFPMMQNNFSAFETRNYCI